MRLDEWTSKGNKLGEVGWEHTLTTHWVEEKRTRGGRVCDRSGVYKITMVRMCTEHWRNWEWKGLNQGWIEMFITQFV